MFFSAIFFHALLKGIWENSEHLEAIMGSLLKVGQFPVKKG